MVGQFIKGRVYVFIDAANILYSQQTLRWRVDYKKLKAYFEKECALGGIYFYTGRVGDNHKRVIVMSTKGHVSKELLERAKYINIKKLKDRIAFIK